MITEEELIALMKPGCICKGIKLHVISKAIDDGATSFDEVARVTDIGGGSCKSKRCGEKVASLLKKDFTNPDKTELLQ